MKKQNKSSAEDATKTKKTVSKWKNHRYIISKSIPLEVDLENRQIFFQNDIVEKLDFDFSTNNVDKLINSYVDPKDSKKVIKSLTNAKKGLEKPILFNFIHPVTSRAFQFEYRYQIIYVKYSSTRLQGELYNIRESKPKKTGLKSKKLK